EAGAVAVVARAGVVARGPRIEVDDPLAALGAIAGAVRGRSSARVVGITGSTGKTTTKDLLAAALATRLDTVASTASYNNEVGLPLTLARLEPGTQALVVEIGSRGRGHIASLARLARPEVGVVLNVGVAHLGMFGSQQAIAVAKGELVEALPAAGTAVLNADDPLVAAMAARSAARVLPFGVDHPGAEVRAEGVSLDGEGRAHFKLRTPGGGAQVALPAPGEHLVSNALAAAAAAHALGLDPEETAAGLRGARLSPMRMQVGRRTDGLMVINDAYNANPTSMAASLKTLATARRDGRAVAVLGEMAELGERALAEHDRVGRLVARLGIDRLVGVGEPGAVIVRAARMEGMWPEEAVPVADADAAVAALEGWLGPDDVVLVKASRVIALDRVAERLLSGPEGARAAPELHERGSE
ncbi:MAG TPA: UDP-N-acetylmuramoyl-tripeptide--D-alanyl-D-alanine ligase, partial [Actinomycetota bacterium]|nr:UDP-N-acetylmuramoyl-tripeptide--D-alanyl-D-alanine ligase [Actinomycetota bacterium]